MSGTSIMLVPDTQRQAGRQAREIVTLWDKTREGLGRSAAKIEPGPSGGANLKLDFYAITGLLENRFRPHARGHPTGPHIARRQREQRSSHSLPVNEWAPNNPSSFRPIDR
ncbi:hypothetical protein GCM10009096_07170 [Parasphingorhabdus litoris]|uniref:Uncharacterized protein n=1 Tax=Parasphingorhabdus litoris TaxID=394733 RepID=A0ABP3K0T2_9SPHN